MTTMKWQPMLLALALAGGCTNTTSNASQPSAASAGSSSPAAAGSSGSGAAAAGRAAVGGAQTKPASGASGTGAQPGSAGHTAPTGSDLDDAGSGEAPVGPGEPSVTAAAGETALSADLVVPAGTTMRVAAGSTFKAATDIKVQVLGELIVQGTADSPVTFAGTAAAPRSWHGIVVESGGKLTLQNTHISGAIYGLFISPGAEFSVDSSVIDTSFKAAVVQSNGSFTHTHFVATAPDDVSLASEVTVDDPNGALTIMDASPTITDCQFDGASSLTDLVRIGGMASPVFDHVYLHDAHCAFHTYGGTNTSATIRHARMKNFAYAFMAYTTKPIVEDSVFITNSNDFGICLGATEDNAPVLKNNYYSAGEVQLDPSCFNIGIADASPATADDPSIGTTSTFKD